MLDDLNSPGWISSPLDDLATQNATTADSYPSSNADVAFDPLARITQLAHGITDSTVQYGGYYDDRGNPLMPPAPMLSADEANAKYGITPPSGAKGLIFTGPVPDSVAADLNASKRNELAQIDATFREPTGTGNTLARGALEVASTALDPLNWLAAVIPGGGEAAAAKLGLDALEGVGGATVSRLVSGGISGLVQQAPLVGLRYGLSQQDQSDYSATAAMRDLAMGGLFGAGLHAIGGAIGDLWNSRFAATPAAKILDRDPATREASLGASVAAVAEDRPVDVADLIDLGGLQADHLDQLNSLRDEAAGLRQDLRQVQGPAPDLATADRIQAIEEELTDPEQTLSQNRRAELLQEHDMLTQGSAPTAQDVLDQARADAQRQGLQAALDRTNQRMAELQERIVNSDAAKRAAGASSPIEAALSDAADQAVARIEPSPLPPAVKSDELQSLFDAVKQMRDSGRLHPEDAAQFDELAASAKNDTGTAAALKSAALCLMGSM